MPTVKVIPRITEMKNAPLRCSCVRFFRWMRAGPMPIWENISMNPTTTKAMAITPNASSLIWRASMEMKTSWRITWLVTFSACHPNDFINFSRMLTGNCCANIGFQMGAFKRKANNRFWTGLKQSRKHKKVGLNRLFCIAM